MRLRPVILLLTISILGAQLCAQAAGDQLQAKLASAQTENATLRKLVNELTDLSNRLNADLVIERRAVKDIRRDKLKAASKHKTRDMEYKLALAENKMLKARIKSLIRSGRTSTTKPSDASKVRRNVRFIEIELHENLWKWWSDPDLLGKHISLRNKLTYLDVDHSIDAWLTRNRQFAGRTVNWTMRLVSGSITSKKNVDKALKQADKNLTAALQAAVYGNKKPKVVDNARYKDGTIAARTTTRPSPKRPARSKKPETSKSDPYDRSAQINIRKQIRDLQERIELYKRASAAGGLTTIYAVSGNIAVKMAIPGRHFENISLSKRPPVRIKGAILRAAPKAGFFIGRTDSMMQFTVSGECTLKNPPPKSE